MQPSDTTKYFIHAKLRADGVVERSDVVGAIFGQTEGLLGAEMDLRELQESGKVSRMDVNVESTNGQSYGTITIGSSLDRVETSVLAAALETIDRIGPCEAYIEIELIEDVRTTKRKEVVDRAKHILTQRFDDSSMTTEEILNEVRETVGRSKVVSYAGHPAGPEAEESDELIVVEGRSDVLNLLQYGIKNTVAVEGTNIQKEIAEITRGKVVTAFLDNDRGGDLILKELKQVGEVDFVAWPPEDKCVEDLNPHEITESLKDKIPMEVLMEDDGLEIGGRSGSESLESVSGGGIDTPTDSTDGGYGSVDSGFITGSVSSGMSFEGSFEESQEFEGADLQGDLAQVESTGKETSEGSYDSLDTAFGRVEGKGRFMILDDEGGIVEEGDADEVKEAIKEADGGESLVVDDEADQSVLDVATRTDLVTVVCADIGYVAKKPLDVNVVTNAEL